MDTDKRKSFMQYRKESFSLQNRNNVKYQRLLYPFHYSKGNAAGMSPESCTIHVAIEIAIHLGRKAKIQKLIMESNFPAFDFI